MPSFALSMMSILFSILAFSGLSFAEDSPKIKPGLWKTTLFLHDNMVEIVTAQVSSIAEECQQAGQSLATSAEECMSLEEALKMKDNILRGKVGYIDKECITSEQANNYFTDILDDEECNNTLQWLGNGQGILDSTCTSGTVEHSDIDVKDQKEIVVVTTSTDKDHISVTSTWQGKWLADDCGSVEPED
tara:strand:+ start:12878 stop:13444 length:567 start_codon:yes stop_codon:yes gene_type:complete